MSNPNKSNVKTVLITISIALAFGLGYVAKQILFR